MNVKKLFLAGSLMVAPAFASTHPIQYETFSYPSPAVTHLDILQRGLAVKAIETCKAKENVRGIDDISVTIVKGVSGPVGVISDKSGHHGPTLDLWYPKIKASAVVECGD